ncbi:MAG: DUF401 family protein [Elusimicrobia bacterium]|nr:DUF401 family protein [Elusimicrobiota bacterium]
MGSSFVLAVAVLLISARKYLWLGLVAASLILGIFNLSAVDLLKAVTGTFADPSVLLMAAAVGLIPVIGAAMETSGLMNDLANNLRLNTKVFLASSPALIGMLPMPGGALLSAPIVARSGSFLNDKQKTAINVWFRHVLVFIYPLSPLLVASKVAGVALYAQVIYLLPYCGLLIFLGYWFLLRNIKGQIEYESHFDLKKLLVSLSVIMAAPLVHLTLVTIFPGILKEACLLTGVSTSVLLAFLLGGLGAKSVKLIVRKMKPWNFALIIIGVFLFLNVFKASGAAMIISQMALPKVVLLAGVGVFFGFLTGRVDVAVAMLAPIYFLKYGRQAMTHLEFTFAYFSVFMGYVMSPVHPCALVSLQYFHTELKDLFKMMGRAALIALAVNFLAASLLLPSR